MKVDMRYIQVLAVREKQTDGLIITYMHSYIYTYVVYLTPAWYRVKQGNLEHFSLYLILFCQTFTNFWLKFTIHDGSMR